MTGIQLLSQIRMVDEEISALDADRAAAYTSLVSSPTGSDTGIHTASGGNTYESKLIKYIQYVADLNARIDQLCALKSDCMRRISMIDDQEQRIVLVRRYIRGETFAQIAEERHRTERQIYRLHRAAIESFTKIW